METLLIFGSIVAAIGTLLTILFWLTDIIYKQETQEHLHD